MYAERLAGLGRPAEALAAIDQALARSTSGGERWFVPELLRNRAELLAREDSADAAARADACLRQVLGMAREQDALFWELRIALSLARLRLSLGRTADARSELTEVYGRFTEGFETADLRAARTLLDIPAG